MRLITRYQVVLFPNHFHSIPIAAELLTAPSTLYDYAELFNLRQLWFGSDTSDVRSFLRYHPFHQVSPLNVPDVHTDIRKWTQPSRSGRSGMAAALSYY